MSSPAIAVQRLNPRHRDDILRHLTQLPENDRRLRFGHPIRDSGIAEYVSRLDFDQDKLFGVHSPAMELVGVAHLALDRVQRVAELGLSVNPALRVKGYGFALLERGVLHAANLGYRTLFMVCLAENHIMMHLARKAGLQVVVEYGEADARLALDHNTHGGALKEAMADQLALVDCILKQQILWTRPAGQTSGKQSEHIAL